MNAVFRPEIDTPFSPTAFKDLEMKEGGSSENPIVLDEEQDKVNFSPKTLESERAIKPTSLHRSGLFGRPIKNVTGPAHKFLFE